MWIKSQNEKGLIFSRRIIIIDNQVRNYYENDEHYDVLGKYKTEDRCITILDEILNSIFNAKEAYSMPRE